MLYPHSDYTYVNEYGQQVDPSNYNEQFYSDHVHSMPTQMVFENQPTTVMQTTATLAQPPAQHYQSIINNTSQPL